jgi:hypothetical protein
LIAALIVTSAFAAASFAPSRPPFDQCTWEPFADARLGLETFVQRCEHGTRIIDFAVSGDALVMRDSGGSAYGLRVEVIARQDGETPKAAITRAFKAHTDAAIAARCVLEPYEREPPPPGVTRFEFEPGAAYEKELEKTQGDGIPESACGPWGHSTDGEQYFEVPANADARAVLFVVIGPSDALFDELRLKVLPK